jgi:hypothetical protein
MTYSSAPSHARIFEPRIRFFGAVNKKLLIFYMFAGIIYTNIFYLLKKYFGTTSNIFWPHVRAEQLSVSPTQYLLTYSMTEDYPAAQSEGWYTAILHAGTRY